MSISYLAPAAGHEQLEWLGGGVLHVLLDGQRAAGQPTMLRGAPARGFASPVHVHANEDEVIVLLRGSGIFWAGDRRYELGEGGVAFLPRGVPHAYRFTSPAVELLAVGPPGRAEDFLRAAGWDLSQPWPAAQAVTPASMAAAAAATGQVVLGPPLQAGDRIPAACLGRRLAV
jgi:quercetin dioxygenase-like cupin family protein